MRLGAFSIRAVSQLLWPHKDREEWFSWERTTKRSLASVYTNCETALAHSSMNGVAAVTRSHTHLEHYF